MPTRRQLIQKITLGSSASSVTFSNIPQNYKDLKILTSTRLTTTDYWMGLNINGSSSDFSCRHLQGSGSSASRNFRSDMTLFLMSNNSSFTSTAFAIGEANFLDYSSSNQKVFYTKSTQENSSTLSFVTLGANLWNNTSPISSMTMYAYSGSSFTAGSTFYLYGITHVPIINGGEVSIRDGFKIHTFLSTSALQVVEPGDVDALVIAGGGAGGGAYGGGGGAGGYVATRMNLTRGTHTVAVGGGGSSVTGYVQGNDGSNSSLSEVTAIGGGGGGYYTISDSVTGRSGGSGGGGGVSQTQNSPRPGGAGTAGQGNAGGSGNRSSVTNQYLGGGGGGAGAVGGSAVTSTSTSGNGGIGLASSITGTSVYRAGGGGASGQVSAGSGGLGGGGNGVAGGVSSAYPGAENTGGGGGGIVSNSGTSGAGGSGIVVIRYPYDGN